MSTHKRIFFILTILVTLVVLSQCVVSKNLGPKAKVTNFNGQGLTGSLACRQCHARIYDSFSTTAHFASSQLASASTVKGSFLPPSNVFYFDYTRHVEVVSTDSGLYQLGFVSDEKKRAERFDIVIGSGTKGQTYLYWKQDSLFQLPLTYFTALNSWVNSPGFPAHEIVFERPITIQCLECHATNFKEANQQHPDRGTNIYDKSQVLLEIGCERCHGPGAAHVAFHQAYPSQKKARYITNNKLLDRQAQLDVCAQCHSGMRQPIKPSFSFVPGEKLLDYSQPVQTDSNEELDVHGNQHGLLASSKCFILSQDMICSSCHGSHGTERNVALFSKKCMHCHEPAKDKFCKLYPELGEAITQNCIDCHMPQKPSKIITLLTDGNETVANKIRTHLIKVYPAETKKYLPLFKH